LFSKQHSFDCIRYDVESLAQDRYKRRFFVPYRSNTVFLFGELGSIDMAGKQDRRVQRTKQLLRGALISLIKENGFEPLSVQDIIDRANVGRATFYAHFDNKEDLLVSGFDELRASLKQRQHEALARGGSADEGMFAFSYEMFAHVDEYRDVFRAMVGKHSGAMIQHLVHKLLIELVREDMKAMVARAKNRPVPTEALAEFIAGGFLGLLIWWLDGKMRPSVEEVNATFRRLAIPSVKAALR
jgi:AcrR family transcriptional regulator